MFLLAGAEEVLEGMAVVLFLGQRVRRVFCVVIVVGIAVVTVVSLAVVVVVTISAVVVEVKAVGTGSRPARQFCKRI